MVTSRVKEAVQDSDAALIGRIVQRDESALEALYDRYTGMLSAVLNRILRDRQSAEEILQDIFYQLWRKASEFDATRGSLPGWLMVIARNRAISRLRHRNPAAGEELPENMAAGPVNIESALSQQQLLERVKVALGKLPVQQRAAMELAYFEASRIRKSPSARAIRSERLRRGSGRRWRH